MIGEDVKWALGIAVTALVLMAFLLHVPSPWCWGRGGLGGASETGTPARGTVRFLSGRAEMLLSR